MTATDVQHPRFGGAAVAGRCRAAMSALVEAGLRLVLARSSYAAEEPPPPLPTWDSGGQLVDIEDRVALCRAMEGERLMAFDTNAPIRAADERAGFGLAT